MDFRSPFQSLLGGQDYSTAANDINGNFNPTPPPATTGVPLPAPTQEPNLAYGGFLSADGYATQNIISDPNQMGLYAPGPTTYQGGSSLYNPGGYRFPYKDDDGLSS